MTIDSIISLAGFALVMSLSPGPGNFLLLTSGANFGFMRTLPLLTGICAGFLLMVVLASLGLGAILQQNPVADQLLRLTCALYVLWLAIKIARSRSLNSNSSSALNKPIGFIQAAMFQWLNPKAWAVALIVTVSWLSQDSSLSNLILLVFIFALINLPSISLWALSGAALRQWLSQGNRIAFFNIAMALILVGTMLPMLIRY